MKNLLIVLVATILTSLSAANALAQAPIITTSGGYVIIGGTQENDTVVISYSQGELKVTLRNRRSSLIRTFPRHQVDRIFCDLRGGNDQFWNHTYFPETVYFTSGTNFAQCGSANSTVIGGDGTDWIFGGDGDDHLRGGRGQDLLVGGEGEDELYSYRIPSWPTDPNPNDGDVDVIYATFWEDRAAYTPGQDIVHLR